MSNVLTKLSKGSQNTCFESSLETCYQYISILCENILTRLIIYYQVFVICIILIIYLQQCEFVVLLHKAVSQNELKSYEIDRVFNKIFLNY